MTPIDARLKQLLELQTRLQASGEMLAVLSAAHTRDAKELQSILRALANEQNSNATDKAACSNSRDTALTLKTSETSSEPIAQSETNASTPTMLS